MPKLFRSLTGKLALIQTCFMVVALAVRSCCAGSALLLSLQIGRCTFVPPRKERRPAMDF
jgi:hypothetical protein